MELRDVLPTFLDIAGATVPADMDGCPLYRWPKEPIPGGENILIWNMPLVIVVTTTGVR